MLDLKLPKMGRKLKQSLEIPILTRELYVFTRTVIVSVTVAKARLQIQFSSFLITVLLSTDVLNGYNGTIFAYGQTSSGKTHTMEVS